MAMYSILFVDDEISILDGLRRIFYSMQNQWNMTFCKSGADAISEIESKYYDVIVSDLRMPEMDGIHLLEQVKEISPNTVRFMLSGYNDEHLIATSLKCAHQFLSKPCEFNIIKEQITQALCLHKRRISDDIKSSLSSLNSLAAMPGVYNKLMQMLSSPSSSIRDIGALISSDVSMSAKVLQLVNSAFYGVRRKVADPMHAAVYLGLNTIKGLVLLNNTFSRLDEYQVKRFRIDLLQSHCMKVAGMCRKLYSICPSKDFSIEDVTTAGLLHDVGKIAIMQLKPNECANIYTDFSKGQRQLWQIELETIGMTHGDAGGYLLELWGLPPAIIETVTYHNNPMSSNNVRLSALSITYMANELSKQGADISLSDLISESEYLASLDIDPQLGLLFDKREHEHAFIDNPKE